jgi:sugar lactone lactonase YvrE
MTASKMCSNCVQLISSTKKRALGLLSLGVVAMLLSSIDSAAVVLVNSDFETGNLSGWTSYTTNSDVMPTVDLFDTSHSGTPSYCASFHAGNNQGNFSIGGAGIFQDFFAPLQGNLTLGLDAAAYDPYLGPLGAAGVITVFFDHVAVASVDFGSINGYETKYAHLTATIPSVAPGTHELRVQATKWGIPVWYTAYQYVDNITVEGTAVPEPSTWSLLALGAVALLGSLRLRRRYRFSFKLFCIVLAAPLIPAQAQNVFVSESDTGNISEFTPSGERTTFASGLYYPTGLVFDGANNLFVADGSGDIYKFTPSGDRSTFASGVYASGLAIDSAGNLFAAAGSSIYRFTPDGQRSTFGSVYLSWGLAFDNWGNLFVADYGSRDIYKFTPDGTRSTFASGFSGYFIGLACDSSGNLFANDYGRESIYKFTVDGTRSTFLSSRYIFGLACDSLDNLLATGDGGEIFKFTPDGAESTFASGLSGPFFLALQVPEPSTWSLLTLGAVALLGGMRLRRRSS